MLRVFVSTWNVGGIAPEEDLNIDDLLETCNETCDIYILGYYQKCFRFSSLEKTFSNMSKET